MSAVGRSVTMTAPGPRRRGLALAVLAGLFAVGAASFVYALASDSADPDFALLTVTFLYLMGISQAGVVFSSILRIVGAHWSKPYYRFAELATLAFAPFALGVFLLIYIYARGDLFYWASADPDAHLNAWLDLDWLLIRNLLGLLLFYGVSTVYVLKALKPDLTTQSEADQARIESELQRLSPWVILAFVVCNTFFAWDFGMMLVEHWYSTVFPIYFAFGNLFAGSAALVLIAALLGRPGAEGSYFELPQIRNLGILVTGFTLIWLYLFWAQFFVIWFGNLPREMEPLWRQMYGHYAPYYWTMMSACFFVPFAAFVFAAVKRSLLAMCLLALSINLGIWLNKYLTVVPVFSPDDRPFDSWLDIALALGLLSGFLALLLWLIGRWPAYSYWEIKRRSEPEY